MAVLVPRTQLVRHRIERFFLIVALLYIALVARLVYLQAIRGAYYRNKAANMRAQEIPLVAQRGDLVDRDGKPLAVTTHIGTVVCDPTLVKDPAKAAAALAPYVEMTPEKILPLISPQKMKNGKNDRYVIVKEGLPAEIADSLRQAITEHGKDLAGLSLQEKPDRTYPAGRESVHVVGMVKPGADSKPLGVMGMEKSLDNVLRGNDGYMKAEVDARRRVIPDTQQERKDSRDGYTVKLTIDQTIQHIAESELAKCCELYKPEGATAIVLDPKTGEVLALASYPSFDPQTKAELQKSAEPLSNHALSLYEPGSTLKILTAATALDNNIITTSSTFYCGGSLQVGKKQIKCVMHHGEGRGHGTETITDIIRHSCNVGTAQVGMKLGMDLMEQCLRDFNMLENTGVGLPADNHGRLGLGAEAQRNSLSKVARVAFGQAVMVTPMALASAYAAIANGGLMMKPHMVLAYQDSNGKTVKEFKPEKLRQVVKPSTAAELNRILQAVITSGTGKGSANIPGYTVAGKTGTAQKVGKGEKSYSRSKYVASFIGYVPANNPKAVILVLVDEPKGGKIYGAQIAAPVFQAIGQQTMWYLKVPPDDPASLRSNRVAKK
jgi:stage V sporulation protein D (sporulation-specific penicillin-binding protein)